MRFRPIPERFWEKVDKSGGPDACWPWLASLDQGGYGLFHWVTGHRPIRAYRMAYELVVGPIPGGLSIDHLCHSWDSTCAGGTTCPHRRCVNPAHLEPVTREENSRRQAPARRTHCAHGHLFDEANARWTGGRRTCLACIARRSRDGRARRARAALGATETEPGEGT